MRRIIAVLSIVALFGCSDRTDDAAGDGGSAATAQPQSTPTPQTPANAAGAKRNIVFLGTSLTAGYGVGAEVAFPALIQQRIDSAGLPFTVTNAGISGETSAGGLRRIDWILQNPIDVLVLELGANDGLRGLDVDSMKQNLGTILERTRAKYPDAAIVIAGMEAPPNLGTAYTRKFHSVYADLARQFGAQRVTFLLQDVAGVRELNQEDGIHPNPAGHRRVADNVWATLLPVLQQRAAAR